MPYPAWITMRYPGQETARRTAQKKKRDLDQNNFILIFRPSSIITG